MKTAVVFAAFAALAIQCATPERSSTQQEAPYAHYRDLAQVLRYEPGLYVTGLDWNVNIKLARSSDRGVHYIVNGQDVGDSYLTASQSFTMDRVKAIRVIRSLSERSTNGRSYPQGAIEIWTR